MFLNLLKNIAKSKTMQGIVVAAVGAALPVAEVMFPEYVGAYKIASPILEAFGLGWATYGRIKATGPITSDAPKL